MMEIDGVSVPFIPIGGVEELKKHSPKVEYREASSFNHLFQEELKKLKFSAHAMARINSRELKLTEEDIKKLQEAVDKAGAKGSNEALILLGEKAFIVSVPNRTVITVVNKNQMESNVITNIDSAVLT